ncbi:MAG: SHOCT domain-containing protein [Chloroflexi bacterium]|nr:SHOCT domain-containing protein [Chloroflexota bacterium]
MYIITRPRLDSDIAMTGTRVPATATAVAATKVSAADQVAKLSALHDSGALTDAEFEAAKAKALA